jgi:hypothetical protein
MHRKRGTTMRYHYVITLQAQLIDNSQRVSYESGTVTPKPGETRADLFGRIAGRLMESARLVNPVPLFFSLEPDELQDTPDGPGWAWGAIIKR